MMFIPLDNTKLPEQIGKVIVTTMLQQTLVDRCRTLLTTYPCAFLTEEDKRNCAATQYTPCFTRENPPPGYGFGQWEMVNSFEELLTYRRQYTQAGNEPALIISDPPSTLKRRKRSPLRKLSKRRRKKGGSSSSSKSGGSRGGSMRGSPSPSRNILMRLGAGSGVGAGLGAGEDEAGCARSWGLQHAQPSRHSPNEHSNTSQGRECFGDPQFHFGFRTSGGESSTSVPHQSSSQDHLIRLVSTS